jgi:serine/threonine protein kinase/Tol biopolymer transport system component
MTLTAGSKLGPYEIVAPLGAGGMGEVYRARDTRLERTVAIKILPAQFSSDPVRKQRFEREAKTISSLNHPHICVLYDVGSQDGVDYLVMECVEGETLAKRLEKGALPLEQVLKFGAQIADALDKAHRSGVVHRDLKPGNIMLTPSGAKLLDFGLAKPAAAMASLATMTVTAAKQSPATEHGTIVGTFQYMSPEQIEGKELDGRSDIFSLGAVLYEMLTGQRAFDGKSQVSVASAILEKEPQPISATKPMTPPALDHAIKKCLAKLPDERWQSASDLASELKWITEDGSQAGPAVRAIAPGKIQRALPWLMAGVLTGAAIVGAVRWPSSKPPEQALYFSASFPLPAHDIAIAPNGHTLAVVSYHESARKNVVWICELGSQSARYLADTEGATYSFWSPDSRSIGFFADGKLKRIDVSGGPVQTICDAPSGRGGTWNRDGVIVFTPDARQGGGLYRVSASGGTPTQINSPDPSRAESSYRWPMFLPDGTHYLFMVANFTGRKEVNAIFVGSLDSKEKRFILQATANAAYAAPGYLLFCRDKDLLAQGFDLQSFALTGEAATILSEIQYHPQIRRAVYAVSDKGFLLAQTGSGVALSQPIWFDRKGKEIGAVGKPDVYGNVSIAPNGKSVALSQTDMTSPNQNSDIWTYELQREGAKRLTFDASNHAVPVWSPDSARLVFASNRLLNFDLYMKNADGAQQETTIMQQQVDKWPNDWSSDGRYIVYTRGTDLWSLTIPELKTSLFLKAPSVFRNAQFSPDGKWVAYASNETGKWQIYVASFPEAHGTWQISTVGGEQPRWRGDGKELFYLSSDYKMMAAPVSTGPNFDSGQPVALFQTTPRQPVSFNDLFVYDVSRDGQRFLINTVVKEAATSPMSVVLNWPARVNK